MVPVIEKTKGEAMSWSSGVIRKWKRGKIHQKASAVEVLGEVVADLTKPVKLVDFSTHPGKRGKVKFHTISAGPTDFTLIRIHMPERQVGPKFEDFALIPGKTLGLAWVGLERTQSNHTAYWERWYRLQLLGILRSELVKKKALLSIFSDPQLRVELVEVLW